jgi:uncharacterized protein (DUF58 family)
VRRRSSRAVALGLVALIGSSAFGSTPLAVVGLGFVLVGLLARGWARLVGGAIEIERGLLPGDRLEGNDLVVEVRIRHRRRLLLGSVVVRQRLGEIERDVRMRRSRSEIIFSDVCRGRHELEPLEVVIIDPLGLERVEQQLEEREAVLVRPRIPLLTSVFSTNGARDAGTNRSRFRRPAGFEIHAVREYAPGEPLRAVHWPSTARRGRLMVKDLEDAPLDDVAVILDQDRDGVAGPPGRSSFDAAVRAAGALALAHVQWSRRVSVVGTAHGAEVVRIRSVGHDWEVALDALASITPVLGARVDRALRDPATAVSRARELVVVTGRPDRAVGPLLELRRAGRAVSLVVIAPETFAGRRNDRPNPAILRAATQGIPVALVSAESSIEEALAGRLAGVIGA